MRYKIQFYGNKEVPFIIVDNWFSESELKLLWEELDSLTHPSIMMPPNKTGSATNAGGNYIKNNSGIFLDKHYKRRREESFILRDFLDKWNNLELKMQIARHNWFMNYINKFNEYTTLLSYYQNADCYLPHNDESLITICIHVFKEPAKFSGGELSIEHVTLPLTNNRMILFPSIASHSVNPVIFHNKGEKNEFTGDGRYTITHFLDYNSILEQGKTK